MDRIEALESALARERAARAVAEELLERKSAELFAANRRLVEAKLGLEHRVEVADERLRRNLSRLRLALEAASAGALAWRPDEDVVELDEALRAMTGGGADGAACPLDAWLQRIDPASRATVRATLERARGADEVDCEFRLAAGDRILHLRGRRVGDEVVALVRDVTKQRHLQLDRRRLATARERSERLAVLGELASSIAHEINQPLGSIRNYAAAARRLLGASGNADPRLVEALTRIDGLSAEAGEVIRQLRAMLEDSTSEVADTPVAALLDAAIDSVRTEARDAGVGVESEATDARLRCVPLLLERALANLVRNAIEAMESARLRGAVSVRCREEEGWVVLQVDDEGPGLGGLDPEEIFEPLVTSRPAGSGMGLALCRTVAERHGGAVRCVPNPHHPTGLRFELRIPKEASCSRPSTS